MTVKYELHRIALDTIKIPENRQRVGTHKVGMLADSIRRNGLYHPIILRRDQTLVTGACRLAAFKKLASGDPNNLRWKLIPAQYIDEIDEAQLVLVELEENIHRTDLTWQEQAQAVQKYVDARTSAYTGTGTIIGLVALELGMTERNLRRWIQCARAIQEGDEKVISCETIGAALNYLQRKMERAVSSGIKDILGEEPISPDEELTGSPEGAVEEILANIDVTAPKVKSTPSALKIAPEKPVVRIGDFLNLAPRYDGPPFNFIHCDFPYGIGYDKSEQGNAASRGAYEDSEKTFWNLFECLLDNRERLVAGSAHIMFWFHMRHYEKLRVAFSRISGWMVNPMPLIWHKADNIGIVPDARRRPRQVYETAFVVTVGDRPLVVPGPNCVSSPSERRKSQHISQKSEKMLSKFFEMFVDASTRLLDPTCGSGTALATGIAHGAKAVIGWEISPEYAELANTTVFEQRVRNYGDGREATDTDPLELDLDDLTGPTDSELSEIEAEQAGEIGIEDIELDV